MLPPRSQTEADFIVALPLGIFDYAEAPSEFRRDFALPRLLRSFFYLVSARFGSPRANHGLGALFSG